MTISLNFLTKQGNQNLKKGRQCDAQPMGKILSFTVLCIINYAVCRKSLELDDSSILSINKFPGLINGDDCCFPIKDANLWSGTSAIVGLINSVGKTFTSREFVEMNSRTFLVTSNDSLGYRLNLRFHEVPFINFGLMKGLLRSGGGEEKEKGKSVHTQVVEACSRMGMCHRDLVNQFDYIYEPLDYLFKYYHNSVLLDDTLKNIPYYIPEWLGGIGLNPGPNPEERITVDELKCARWIYQNYKKLKLKSMVLSKTCLIDNLINKHISKLFNENNIDESIDSFEMLETQEENYRSLESENQSVYTMMVEYVWRTLSLEAYFKTTDNSFIRAQDRISRMD